MKEILTKIDSMFKAPGWNYSNGYNDALLDLRNLISVQRKKCRGKKKR